MYLLSSAFYDNIFRIHDDLPIRQSQFYRKYYTLSRTANWQFHESSDSIQSSFFQWVFMKIKSTEQMRAAYIFQLVDHSPFIDKLYFDAFSVEGMPKSWTRGLCDWLKGLGLISFDSAEKKPAWTEFLKGLRLIYGESGKGSRKKPDHP